MHIFSVTRNQKINFFLLKIISCLYPHFAATLSATCLVSHAPESPQNEGKCGINT